MGHNTIEEGEKILDKEFKVLNKGFVRLVDYLGSDERIVQSARVSYGKGTKSYREDKKLISYLLRNDHTSPFEQVVFTFHIKLPIFIARQWLRHRTARVNEISGRYSVMNEEFYLPEADVIALQSEDNKQGRKPEPVDEQTAERALLILEQTYANIYREYKKLLDMGIARELSRIVLPLGLFTEMYWQIDLHNLFHFLKLRMDEHAQKEIRDYAGVLFKIASAVCPLACEAFRDYKLGGAQFSKSETDAVRAIVNGNNNPLEGRTLELFQKKISGQT